MTEQPSPEQAVRHLAEHEHVWVFHHTYSDWYDGDEEDIYLCEAESCNERKVVYVPR